MTAPDAVCDLSIKARTGSSATLAWSVPNDDSSVKCYTVYRNGTKIAENIETPEYTNTGLKENEEYTYEVNVGSGSCNGSVFVPEGATDDQIRLAILDRLYEISYAPVK